MAVKERIAKFGKFLSGMVMPNIGGFIAWGLITALFLYNTNDAGEFTTGGWLPNQQLATLIGPMLTYLIPIMIAGQGGYMVGGKRGRVVGMIAIMGAILGSEYTMLMGAMLMGPLAGFVIKKWDEWAKTWTPAGFEMLVDNFSVGILGMLLAIVGFYGIGPLMGAILTVLMAGCQFLVERSLMPLLAIFIEPAKVLFLNNAINHGIFSPIGLQQAEAAGKSIMYMLEANPGPGLGVLLAYSLFCKDDTTRQSAPGAIIIHFFGGIHEIYFPYVLMNPKVIIAPIVGNICAILFYSITGAGLVAPASPGSIIAFAAMSPAGGGMITTIIGVAIAAVVSFLVAAPIVRSSDVSMDTDDTSAAELTEVVGVAPTAVPADSVSKLVFACDAGMGSSAMGATRFGKRLQQLRPDITVIHSSVDEVPSDADVVVCQKTLADRARQSAPATAQIVVINNFLKDPALDALQAQLTSSAEGQAAAVAATNAASSVIEADNAIDEQVMNANHVKLALASTDRETAIRDCGALLKELGCVEDGYIEAMVQRDREATVYLGNGIAIPHGTNEAKRHVKKTGVVALQYPDGIDFDGGKAYLLFGIAGVGDEHLSVLSKLAGALESEEAVEKLRHSTSAEDFLKILG
ncbi:MAG: PTS mannitol transporter subunit IICBA [Atopobiaceae bacterium]|nr:PTS mannitol transporter subunit IICBA [Atopobiaceae bacterium]